MPGRIDPVRDNVEVRLASAADRPLPFRRRNEEIDAIQQVERFAAGQILGLADPAGNEDFDVEAAQVGDSTGKTRLHLPFANRIRLDVA